ncbi:hypothetical protein Tco_0687721 [Tanacetum coccineum]
MTTLAEHIIVAGAENRPLMLEKSMYGSWASRIHLFIKGKKHGRMMLDSIDNGPLVYPTVSTINNQLRTLSNPRNQATIQDGRVTVQQVQGRQTQSYVGQGHMARQCTQPKRPRNAAWFKEKLMLAEAQEVGQILEEEQLAFLADPGISEAPVA